MLLPGFVRCWADNMRMVCNDQGTDCKSPAGVNTTVTDHALSVDPIGLFPVFGPLVRSLQHHGYRLGEDVVVHSYDTRTSPLDHAGSFVALKTTIEQLVEQQGRGVVIVAAGLGARYLSLFMQITVEEAWVAGHVDTVVSVSGVWGGAPLYALTMTEGYFNGWEAVLTKQVVKELAAYTPSLQVWGMMLGMHGTGVLCCILLRIPVLLYTCMLLCTCAVYLYIAVYKHSSPYVLHTVVAPYTTSIWYASPFLQPCIKHNIRCSKHRQNAAHSRIASGVILCRFVFVTNGT